MTDPLPTDGLLISSQLTTPLYASAAMRALLTDHVFRADLMLDSLLINAVLFVASFLIFLALLRSAKRHGSLLGGGE